MARQSDCVLHYADYGDALLRGGDAAFVFLLYEAWYCTGIQCRNESGSASGAGTFHVTHGIYYPSDKDIHAGCLKPGLYQDSPGKGCISDEGYFHSWPEKCTDSCYHLCRSHDCRYPDRFHGSREYFQYRRTWFQVCQCDYQQRLHSDYGDNDFPCLPDGSSKPDYRYCLQDGRPEN